MCVCVCVCACVCERERGSLFVCSVVYVFVADWSAVTRC